MNAYLKKLISHSAYETFAASNDYITPNVSYDIDHVHYNPYISPHNYSQDYLTIESLEDNNTIGLKAFNASLLKTISVSTDDGTTWTNYTSSTAGTALATLNNGDKLLVKGSNTAYGTSSYYNFFTSTCNFNVEGNIMSLIYGDNFIGQTTLNSAGYNFKYLFKNCSKLISAENLILPATTLTSSCYQQMFQGCTLLTTAPELLATTLAYGCYQQMFFACTSLTYIKCLATDISASSCTYNWVSNVASSGTFVKAASMSSWTTGWTGIPSGWTVQDAA